MGSSASPGRPRRARAPGSGQSRRTSRSDRRTVRRATPRSRPGRRRGSGRSRRTSREPTRRRSRCAVTGCLNSPASPTSAQPGPAAGRTKPRSMVSGTATPGRSVVPARAAARFSVAGNCRSAARYFCSPLGRRAAGEVGGPVDRQAGGRRPRTARTSARVIRGRRSGTSPSRAAPPSTRTATTSRRAARARSQDSRSRRATVEVRPSAPITQRDCDPLPGPEHDALTGRRRCRRRSAPVDLVRPAAARHRLPRPRRPEPHPGSSGGRSQASVVATDRGELAGDGVPEHPPAEADQPQSMRGPSTIHRAQPVQALQRIREHRCVDTVSLGKGRGPRAAPADRRRPGAWRRSPRRIVRRRRSRRTAGPS